MSSMYELAELSLLWQEHRPRLLAMLERRIGANQRQRFDPEDVLSEAFLIAQRRWAEFRERGTMTPWAWLYRLALDALIEAWRRENRDCRAQHRDLPFPERTSIQLGLKLMHPGTKPSEAFARQEQIDQIREAIERLPPGLRDVLCMRHFEELSPAEIASILGVNERTVYRDLRRATKQLGELLRAFRPEGGQP